MCLNNSSFTEPDPVQFVLGVVTGPVTVTVQWLLVQNGRAESFTVTIEDAVTGAQRVIGRVASDVTSLMVNELSPSTEYIVCVLVNVGQETSEPACAANNLVTGK